MYLLGEDKDDRSSSASDDKRGEDERPVPITEACREGEKDGGNKGKDQARHDQELGTANRSDTATVDHNGTSDDTKRQATKNISLVLFLPLR